MCPILILMALLQFRFLKPLLLKHGRWHYRRISKVIAYVFYKSAVQVLPQFWLGFSSLFSASVFYYDAMYQVYNVMYTSTPILVVAVFDQDVGAAMALRTPQLYSDGRFGAHHSTVLFWMWIGEGVVHSIFLTYVPMLSVGYGEVLADGCAAGLYDIGIIVFFTVVLTVTVRLAFDLRMVTKLSSFFMIISIFAWVCTWVYASDSETLRAKGFGQINGSFAMKSGDTLFWATVLLASVLCALTSIAREAIHSCFAPTPALVAREIEKAETHGTRNVQIQPRVQPEV